MARNYRTYIIKSPEHYEALFGKKYDPKAPGIRPEFQYFKESTMNVNEKIAKLSLRKGDILVVQKSFNNTAEQLQQAFQAAGEEAGIDFTVPIVFVDNINELKVIRREDVNG